MSPPLAWIDWVCWELYRIDRGVPKRTKHQHIYRHLPLLTLSNIFRVNSRRVDGDRVKMALYR